MNTRGLVIIHIISLYWFVLSHKVRPFSNSRLSFTKKANIMKYNTSILWDHSHSWLTPWVLFGLVATLGWHFFTKPLLAQWSILFQATFGSTKYSFTSYSWLNQTFVFSQVFLGLGQVIFQLVVDPIQVLFYKAIFGSSNYCSTTRFWFKWVFF